MTGNAEFDLIRCAFTEHLCHVYRHTMTRFYPTIGSRGIDERNLVHHFLTGLRDAWTGSEDRPIGWVELPFTTDEDKQDRLDGASYIPGCRLLVLVEAKRIKQGRYRSDELNSERAMQRIREDAERMGEPGRIGGFKDRLCREGDPGQIRVARVFLADIWLDEEDHMKKAFEQWMSGSCFPADWRGGMILKSDHPVYESQESGQKYTLLLAVHPQLLRLSDCSVA